MSEQNQQPEVAAEEQRRSSTFKFNVFMKRCFFEHQIFLIFSTKNGNQNSAST